MTNDGWILLLDRYERKHIVPIYAALRRQYGRVASDLRNYGLQVARMMAGMANYSLDSELKALYEDVGLSMAKQQLQQKSWAVQIITYLNENLLSKASVPISDTTKRIVLDILTKGTTEGWSVDQMVSKLENIDEIRNRARRIVRTETVRAANYGILLGANSYDYETDKTWVEVKDNRTRITHRHSTGVGGEVVPLAEPFSNGLMFPGDPNGAPEEVINCRCRLTIKARRDANGRMIRKPPATGGFNPQNQTSLPLLPQQVSPTATQSGSRSTTATTVVDALTGIIYGITIAEQIRQFTEMLQQEQDKDK